MTQAHKDTSNRIKAAPRAIALVGPHGGGKTSLLESIAAVTGAVVRKGSVAAGSSLGDFSPGARARQMSVEMNVLTAQYLGEEFTFLDCPGSIEFIADTLNLLPGIDAAVVVCEPDAAKAAMLQPFFKRLADAHVPHLLFINKFDKARGPLRALLTALQQASDTPLLLRQIPHLGGRHPRRLCRSGAGTGLRLPAPCRQRGGGYRRLCPREGGPFPDAGKAGRP